MNDKLNAILLVLTFIGGAGVGSLCTVIWLYRELATGRREVRPLDKL